MFPISSKNEYNTANYSGSKEYAFYINLVGEYVCPVIYVLFSCATVTYNIYVCFSCF